MKRLEERFWSKVQKRGEKDCWMWLAYRNADGYGEIMVDGKKEKAHRVSALLAGKATSDAVVRHSCDNPACVNPNHLVPGTQAENVADMLERGRFVSANSRKTHCPQGHAYAGENLYVFPNGNRGCRECHRAAARIYMHQRGSAMRAAGRQRS